MTGSINAGNLRWFMLLWAKKVKGASNRYGKNRAKKISAVFYERTWKEFQEKQTELQNQREQFWKIHKYDIGKEKYHRLVATR